MELEMNGNVEEMPTSVEGFKKHPLYIIERCVSKYQIIHPKEPVGIFKNQPVYHRSALHEVSDCLAFSHCVVTYYSAMAAGS
jgi:xeroderma pigmentosum group C-complementing protein